MTMRSGEAAVTLDGVTKQYGKGRHAVPALHGVTTRFPRGTFTAVMGPSGSGKSTLMQCAAGLDRPTSGSVRLGEVELTRLREGRLTDLRRTRVGFVFQSFNLLPALTVRQNVLLPLRLSGGRAELGQSLARVGLAGYEHRRPGELSGGQQQRVAIARALITEPEVVFADEPTGALDTVTAGEVLGLLRAAVDQLGATVVMVTHDPAAAGWADRVLFLAGGRLVDELRGASPASIGDRMRALAA
jgi:putative ABC transport system ATP-binding protein